jgi:hypothetical protein
VEEHRVVDEDRVLPRPEPARRWATKSSSAACASCGVAGQVRGASSPHSPAPSASRSARTSASTASSSPPRLGRPRGRRLGRPAVVAIEVPAPALGLAVGLQEHAEPLALAPVERLHHELAPVARPGRELLGLDEELRRGDEPHAAALEQPLGRRAGRVRADEVVEPVEALGQRRGVAAVDDLDAGGLELGGEAAHRADHQVHALAVGAQPGQAAERLDEEHARRAVEGGVVARELVAEDERGVVAHPADTAR